MNLIHENSHMLKLITPQEGIAQKGQFQSVRGCRVRRLSRADGQWRLHGNPGNVAHHEASEAEAGAEDQYLGIWDESWKVRTYFWHFCVFFFSWLF